MPAPQSNGHSAHDASEANANGQRRRLAQATVDLSPLPPTGMSALMIELLADYAATGVPPAYLPTVEENAA